MEFPYFGILWPEDGEHTISGEFPAAPETDRAVPKVGMDHLAFPYPVAEQGDGGHPGQERGRFHPAVSPVHTEPLRERKEQAAAAAGMVSGHDPVAFGKRGLCGKCLTFVPRHEPYPEIADVVLPEDVGIEAALPAPVSFFPQGANKFRKDRQHVTWIMTEQLRNRERFRTADCGEGIEEQGNEVIEHVARIMGVRHRSQHTRKGLSVLH